MNALQRSIPWSRTEKGPLRDNYGQNRIKLFVRHSPAAILHVGRREAQEREAGLCQLPTALLNAGPGPTAVEAAVGEGQVKCP